MYYREHIPIVKRNDISPLQECLVAEVKVKGHKYFITCLYRSPSQTEEEFEVFSQGIETTCSNIAQESPISSLFLGDFNAKCISWWPGGINNSCGLLLNDLLTTNGYSQLIKEPTNFEPNKIPTCIDLIFSNQQNIVLDSGVLPSLSTLCHHQIIYAKINLKINLPPPYKRKVWHFKDARSDLIQRNINLFDWEQVLTNLDVNQQVNILTETLSNIFSNFIPNKTISCSYKDPPWTSTAIKCALRRKNRFFKKYTSNGMKEQDAQAFKECSDICCDLIESAKLDYYKKIAEKLNNPETAPKTYWSLLNRMLGRVKVPSIPPLLANGSFVTDFKEKAKLFNNFFSKQCTVSSNGSNLPNFTFKTDKRISDVVFTQEDIFKVIKGLNPNKAHGHDEISIRMIQLCGDSIILPLKIIFENALKTGCFPDSWKKGIIIQVHKKSNKQIVDNYRPISLLPIFGKIFEKIIYNNLYSYLLQSKSLNNNQSGFRTGDSCVNQLIAITHEIYKDFTGNPSLETRGVFLDISKAFDKVWHEGLLFKLRQYGVEGSMYGILKNYLNNRFQSVVLNGTQSSWNKIGAGVPQGSVLGPLLFLIYINDLPDNLKSRAKLFADDTSLFSTVNNVLHSCEILTNDLDIINHWAYQWKMSFNPDPNKQATEVIFSRKNKKTIQPPLVFNNTLVSVASQQKHLGLILDEKLVFKDHVSEKFAKANRGIGAIKRMSKYLPRKSLISMYTSFIRPHLDYADVVYDQPHNASFSSKIETVQYNAALAITGAIKGTSRERLYKELGLESLCDRRWYHRLVLFFNIVNGNSPDYLRSTLPGAHVSRNPTRTDLFMRFKGSTDYFNGSFFPFCVNEWNKLKKKFDL